MNSVVAAIEEQLFLLAIVFALTAQRECCAQLFGQTLCLLD